MKIVRKVTSEKILAALEEIRHDVMELEADIIYLQSVVTAQDEQIKNKKEVAHACKQ